MFQFLSIDIDNPSPTGVKLPAIIVDGYLGATLVAEDSFNVPSTGMTPATFDAINLAGLNINSLVVSVTSSPNWSPLGLGVCAIWGFGRKRKNS
jgi:hypothetical protein